MSQDHHLQKEKSKTSARKRRSTAEGPSWSRCDAAAPDTTHGARTPPDSPAPRRNRSIRAAHPAVYLNTRSHRMLRRAIRIWKRPIPIFSCAGSVKPKLRSFRERVEMLRNRTGEPERPKPMTRSVRDLQLCSSGTDSSPSPSGSSRPRRRSVHPHRTRRYRKQLRWYRMLSSNKRRLQGEEGQPPPAGSSCGKGSERQDDSAFSPPLIRVPTRKTSRRLWRRQLDSSSSDNSPMTADPVHQRPDKQSHSSRISFSGAANESKTSKYSWTDSDSLDINSDLSKEASSYAEKNVNSSDLKPVIQKCLKIPSRTEEQNSEKPADSEASLVSQLNVFNGDVRHHKASADVKQQMISQPERVEIQTSPRLTDAVERADGPRPACVKWKSVLLQRALCSSALPYGNRHQTHQLSCRFTLAGCSTPKGRSDADRPDATSERHDKPAEDHVKNSAAGDSVRTNS